MCQFCGALGFESDVQGKNKNPKNPKEELVYFGDLCCCKGTVKGISGYRLPKVLEMLYTSNKKMQPTFEAMQERTIMQ